MNIKILFCQILILILPITYTLHEIIGKKKKCTEEENYLYYMHMYISEQQHNMNIYYSIHFPTCQ